MDFEEIRDNYLPQQANLEANRCLSCYEAPCRQGCPAGVNVPYFIQAIRSGNIKRAARIINDSNPFGSVCGRVCPVDRLCEEKCVLRSSGKSIQIARLQSYASDNGNYKRPETEKGDKKVAVIGAGPSGLACASELSRNGISVTVFESKGQAGGMVAFGVPQYRCSHNITALEVEKIVEEGVEIRTSTPVNRNVTELFDLGYDAVYVAIGLTKTSKPEIPGKNLKGIYMGLDFLNRIGAGDTPEVGKKVVVIGGGDTALDCARSALRLGAEESTLLYRRSFVELPADKVEIEEALEEGIVFRTLTQPIAFHGDDNDILRAVECVSMKLGKPDESGRRSPQEIKGSNFRIPANTFIFATGTEPSNLLKKLLPQAEYVNDKYIKVNPETMETTVPGVFAGGDVVNRGDTVVKAVAEGKKAAEGILTYMEQQSEPVHTEEVVPYDAPDVNIEQETIDTPQDDEEVSVGMKSSDEEESSIDEQTTDEDIEVEDTEQLNSADQEEEFDDSPEASKIAEEAPKTPSPDLTDTIDDSDDTIDDEDDIKA